jgi:hypothetical protein
MGNKIICIYPDFLSNKQIKIIFIAFFTLASPAHSTEPDSDCIEWFKNGNIKSNSKSCDLDCATLPIDLTTFMCPNQCELLCNFKIEKNFLGKLVYYPGLTPSEKKLVEKNPDEAIKVFIQKNRAEWSSNRNFPEQGLNDEGDAFRHFIWAGLLTKELGTEKAKKFLDAHEASPLQSNSERNMDLFNNDKGISSAQNLIINNTWSLENLEKTGLDLLRSKNLNVLKPGLKIPEAPK